MCNDLSHSVSVIERNTLHQTPQLWTPSVLPHPDTVLSLDCLSSRPHISGLEANAIFYQLSRAGGTVVFVVPKGKFTQ